MSATNLPEAGERLPPLEIGPFDAAALGRYAEVSGDDNPLHLDEELAAAIGFAAPPVHGMKLLAFFEPMLRAWRSDLFIAELGGAFVQPVLRGEKVTLTGRVLRSSKREIFVRLYATGGGSKAPAIMADATLHVVDAGGGA